MIGILVAEQKELEAINTYLTLKEIKNIKNNQFILGTINNIDVVIVKSCVGKVNAAITSQMLIDLFNVKMIINIGVSGSINEKLDIGDIVIGKKLVQYDFDTTAFGRKLGEIENIGEYIECNLDLSLFNNCKLGIIASGDKFITDIEEKKKIRDIFKADCIEMEGASVAQVCYLNNIPFLIIRSISDKFNSDSKIEFDKFLDSSSQKVSKLLVDIIDKL